MPVDSETKGRGPGRLVAIAVAVGVLVLISFMVLGWIVGLLWTLARFVILFAVVGGLAWFVFRRRS